MSTLFEKFYTAGKKCWAERNIPLVLLGHPSCLGLILWLWPSDPPRQVSGQFELAVSPSDLTAVVLYCTCQRWELHILSDEWQVGILPLSFSFLSFLCQPPVQSFSPPSRYLCWEFKAYFWCRKASLRFPAHLSRVTSCKSLCSGQSENERDAILSITSLCTARMCLKLLFKVE